MALKIFPFISWFEDYSTAKLRIDFISGLTVALVLVPQSMAYAQLAGLPAYYGLYAAFLPPMIASLFGSSFQLATGPVAVVSLMTATALEPLATAGSESFIAYAILLAFCVGIFQFALGALRLGLIVNFLSHPVVSGFTNAAAIIIASSQLSKIFGVYVDKAEHHYETIYNVFETAVTHTHLPTLGMAVVAFAVMIVLKRINPRIPGVLIAVIITTLISYAIGFENNYKAELSQFASPEVREKIKRFNSQLEEMNELSEQRVELTHQLEEARESEGPHSSEALRLEYLVELRTTELHSVKRDITEIRRELRLMDIKKGENEEGETVFYLADELPEGIKTDDNTWRMKIANKKLDEGSILLMGGGAVVGIIPEGLPGLKMPLIQFDLILKIFPMAIIISFLGFMEAISIAKAMAAKTGQRLDPNQELIGQGIANIVGSIGQSYAVSGSFSRSAVNLAAGARTGLSNVFSSIFVAITLLLFTPLLYHLPQAVLAAIIMMAVIGLINVGGFIHAWKAQKYDGIIGVITFVCTLGFAPHLDKGIMIGVALSIGLYLFRNIRPDIALLSKYTDGTYRNSERLRLKRCKHIAVVRFNGSLIFANVNFLEEQILELVSTKPELKHILVVGNGINELDASGEDMISALIDRLRDRGYDISFSGLNDSVMDVLRRTQLYYKIGEDHFYRNATRAIESIWENAHKGSDEDECPLEKVCFEGMPVAEEDMISPDILKGPGKKKPPDK
ncbi:MAG: STAS domain-containing protein [candidate division Zixibacteria bacterium]|nr:STAS domain-containing protein [candidate division Zixibacteria bacterium]